MPDDIRGQMFTNNVPEGDINSEAALFLKDAIEKDKSFVVVSCSSPKTTEGQIFDGRANDFANILLGNVSGEDGRYRAMILAGVFIQWLEVATGLPRLVIFKAVDSACRTLDKLKGGGNVSGSEEVDEGRGAGGNSGPRGSDPGLG